MSPPPTHTLMHTQPMYHQGLDFLPDRLLPTREVSKSGRVPQGHREQASSPDLPRPSPFPIPLWESAKVLLIALEGQELKSVHPYHLL